MPYIPEYNRRRLDEKIERLAESIATITVNPYDFAGYLNYSITKLIQLIPKKLVEKKIIDEELRYWIMPLLYGTLTDVILEHKLRTNQAYEAFQIEKNGDCFDTPYKSVLYRKTMDEEKEIYAYQHLLMKKEDFEKLDREDEE